MLLVLWRKRNGLATQAYRPMQQNDWLIAEARATEDLMCTYFSTSLC